MTIIEKSSVVMRFYN